MKKIKLAEDTINKKDIDILRDWLKDIPHLTMGEKTVEFEEIFARWIGTKYAVYVNSGSSANLAIIYALKVGGYLKNEKIVVPAVSWSTTVAPVIQLGLEPILCDADPDNLGVDLNHFEDICRENRPSALMLVHVLGLPCKMDEIKQICDKYDVILLEDCCEANGSVYKNKKLGSFGLASSFSMYFAHAISSCEGGIICTDDYNFYNICKMIRSHGWSRNIDLEEEKKLKNKYCIDDYESQFTFYYPGFNIRPMDIQAVIAIEQMKKIENFVNIRDNNYRLYKKNINNKFWCPKEEEGSVISNHAFPIVVKNRDKLVKELNVNNIENRPLICGSIERQPFWKEYKKDSRNICFFADIIHNNGLYVPNHHNMSEEDVMFICDVVNKAIGE